MTDNSHKTILHLCADIGSDSKPYRDAGYNVICVGKDIGVENYTPPPNVYGIIANPPCTMFSIARTKAKTPRDLRQGMVAVQHCLRIIWECQYRIQTDSQRKPPLAFWALENPGSGYLRWFLGQPRFEYCQSEYGQKFTKRTALWGYFNLPRRPFMELVMKDNVRSLGGNYGVSKHLCFSRDGGPKAECPELFAKEFFYANP
jgi:hypothetical protein